MAINSKATITIEDIAGQKALVIDDVFTNPELVRAYAMQLVDKGRAITNGQGYYVYPDNFDRQFPAYTQELAEIIRESIGESVCKTFGLDLSQLTLHPYKGPLFNCVNKLPRNAPHVDHGHISAFCYMTKPENCSGGTRVYRHIPSNTLNIVRDTQVSLQDMISKPLAQPLVESTEEWEMVHFFEMKYNRLVAMNSSLIHKIDLTGGKFTTDFEETRLGLNCFYHFRQADGSIAPRQLL